MAVHLGVTVFAIIMHLGHSSAASISSNRADGNTELKIRVCTRNTLPILRISVVAVDSDVPDNFYLWLVPTLVVRSFMIPEREIGKTLIPDPYSPIV